MCVSTAISLSFSPICGIRSVIQFATRAGNSVFVVRTRFNSACCLSRKHNPDNYKLIARTKAKSEYLLKDEDLDVRRPILRLVSVKNPHNPRYGDMKLYLELQASLMPSYSTVVV